MIPESLLLKVAVLPLLSLVMRVSPPAVLLKVALPALVSLWKTVLPPSVLLNTVFEPALLLPMKNISLSPSSLKPVLKVWVFVELLTMPGVVLSQFNVSRHDSVAEKVFMVKALALLGAPEKVMFRTVKSSPKLVVVFPLLSSSKVRNENAGGTSFWSQFASVLQLASDPWPVQRKS